MLRVFVMYSHKKTHIRTLKAGADRQTWQAGQVFVFL